MSPGPERLCAPRVCNTRTTMMSSLLWLHAMPVCTFCIQFLHAMLECNVCKQCLHAMPVCNVCMHHAHELLPCSAVRACEHEVRACERYEQRLCMWLLSPKDWFPAWSCMHWATQAWGQQTIGVFRAATLKIPESKSSPPPCVTCHVQANTISPVCACLHMTGGAHGGQYGGCVRVVRAPARSARLCLRTVTTGGVVWAVLTTEGTQPQQ